MFMKEICLNVFYNFLCKYIFINIICNICIFYMVVNSFSESFVLRNFISILMRL